MNQFTVRGNPQSFGLFVCGNREGVLSSTVYWWRYAMRYEYTAKRRTDGKIIHTGTIDDINDEGMGYAANAIRSKLIDSHDEAVGRQHPWHRFEVVIEGGFGSRRSDEGTQMRPKSSKSKSPSKAPAEQVVKDI
ncbi:hypothetical protein Q0601_14905, partial [Paracoccus onubensis]|uniref:hypothetical protein n=1 Tax=Paracoccus onubensis TaxID=1675788 RepID=UPI0027309E7E